MDFSSLSPYVRIAWDSTIFPPYFVDRVIFDYELLYVKEGQIEVTVNGNTYLGNPGDLFLLKPKQRHSIRIVGTAPVRQPHIHFDLFYSPDSPDVKILFKLMEQMSEQELKWFRKDVCSSPPFQLPNYIKLPNPTQIEKAIFDVIVEYEKKIPYSDIAIKGLFLQLWTHLLREVYWQNNEHILSNWEQLMQIKNFLNHQYNPITLNELAHMVNLNKYYFTKIFKNAFGVSPIKYHQMKRIEKAKESIQFTSIPINEIAEKFGFQTIHAFSRAFRNVEGVSPSFYRKGGTVQQ